MKRDLSKKGGFTLVELLAVIVILAVILVIAVPLVMNSINEARNKAFYLSVKDFIRTTKIGNSLQSLEYCYYNSKKDDKKPSENITEMQIIAYKENDDVIYSVFAINDKNTMINTNDFSKLKDDDDSNWVGTGNLTFVGVAKVQLNNISNFKRCIN